MYKVGICGHFGEGQNLINGQTIKTKILTEELKKVIGSEYVQTVDTYGWRTNPFRLLIKCFFLIKNCKNIIILPAHNGVRVFVPLFVLFNKVFHRRLHYVVIGGWLPELLNKNYMLKNQLKKFDGIYVETYTMCNSLKNLGLNNVMYLPNFKRINILKENQLIYTPKEPYKLCTFSRVMKEKGIEEAIEAVKRINSEMNRVVYTLDIYGKIEPGYKERFEVIKKGFPDYISYKGFVNFDKTTEILKNYFALLFPTYYEGEGFPGTIIDAFSAGVPVIATDWKYNKEIVAHGENGYIYKGEIEELVNILRQLVQNPDELLKMKKNCIKEAEKYKVENVIGILLRGLEVD